MGLLAKTDFGLESLLEGLASSFASTHDVS
jgi:hypothetical protein